jgi:hypothetical protein
LAQPPGDRQDRGPHHPLLCRRLLETVDPVRRRLSRPGPESRVLDLLLRHGIAVERLTGGAEVEVETFKIKELASAERLYQGHKINAVKGEYIREKIRFPAGTLFVSTAQPLGALAACLLEPESNDGLGAWNYFDKFLASSWGGATSGMIVPVHRILKSAALPADIVR